MKKRKNHSSRCPAVDTQYRREGEFKAKGALEAIREEMTLAELSKKYGVHPTQTGTCKRAARENMATAFTRKGSSPGPVSRAGIDKLQSVNRQVIA